jgi:hypothetical protein
VKALEQLEAQAVAVDVCEFCGSMDMHVSPAGYHKAGRANQGSMTPQWAPATYSPTLGAVCCIRCWKPRFFAQAAA